MILSGDTVLIILPILATLLLSPPPFDDTVLTPLTPERVAIVGRTDSNIKEIFTVTDIGTIEVRYGKGGYISFMESSIDYLKANPHKKVVVNGNCYSACTMLLSKDLDNVCFTRNAKFYFHSAYIVTENGDGTKQKAPDGNLAMMKQFSEPLKEYLVSHNALDSVDAFFEIDHDAMRTLTNKSCS